jgi:hypothetical protein
MELFMLNREYEEEHGEVHQESTDVNAHIPVKRVIKRRSLPTCTFAKKVLHPVYGPSKGFPQGSAGIRKTQEQGSDRHVQALLSPETPLGRCQNMSGYTFAKLRTVA